MMAEFHFLRPLWFTALIPLVILAFFLFKQRPAMQAWNAICDPHLLPFLIQTKGSRKRTYPMLTLLTSALFMIISMAGPTWSRLPVPTYQQIQPRVLVLDMTQAMLENDLSPDRLSRAKFKLHDLFQHRDAGQFGLVVYAGEPFVVSPLTDDGKTIAALLPALTSNIMPVDGNNLAQALEQAGLLITQAGFQAGQILVLTAHAPSLEAIDSARALSKKGIDTSVIPMRAKSATTAFQSLASAGNGQLIPFTDTTVDLDRWLRKSHNHSHYGINLQQNIPTWRDQGRWFIIPALLLLLPAFRRGWLQRLSS